MAFGDLGLSPDTEAEDSVAVFCNASVIKIESTLCQDRVDKRLKSNVANSLSLVFGPLSCISDSCGKTLLANLSHSLFESFCSISQLYHFIFRVLFGFLSAYLLEDFNSNEYLQGPRISFVFFSLELYRI